MKLFIASLMLSSVAFAQDASVFTGKFTVEASDNCESTLFETAPSRAYSYLKRFSYYNNLLSLNIDVYGADAAGDSIVLENGSFQTVGTDESIHGKVTDTVKAKWVSPTNLVVEVKTERPSLNFKSTSVTDISIIGKVMTVKKFTKGSTDLESLCVFTKK